ncbi:MAG: DegT/DnrJ/EryC1/StrS family aminotransferase [Candidatus Margulisbacteria bacterium]|jgi:perosamine synthetase|nr:DegT/DnrJ/EryC1/StrS family aminotransferase [Candidatus Margulisiibacteriota bacterium]
MEDKNNRMTKYPGNELKYLQKVLSAESWSATGGSWNNILEREFAKKLGVKYAVAMNSGTATLHAALEAVGVGPGDEVISPAFTVFMDTSATLHANAVPVYADIDPATWNIDPKDVARKITPKTKAIIAVSIYGLAPDLDPIMELASKNGLAVIEDNAQSMLNTYKGRMVGTIGHMASYSFENTKHLSCGEGGMIITDNEAYAETARKIGGHGFKNLRAEEGRIRLNQEVFQNPHYKRHDTLGWNYRLSEFNAAIVLAQLERVEELVKMRQEVARLFLEAASSCDYLIPQHVPAESTHSYFTFGALYDGLERIGVSWEEFRRMYVEMGGDGFYGAWSVPYLEPIMVERKYVKRCPDIYRDIKYGEGLCPVAEDVQLKVMQFKANYRSLELAKQKASVLERLIVKLKNR